MYIYSNIIYIYIIYCIYTLLCIYIIYYSVCVCVYTLGYSGGQNVFHTHIYTWLFRWPKCIPHMFGLCTGFLVHNSQGPLIFLSYKSNGNIFLKEQLVYCPQFLKSLQSQKGKMYVLLFITSLFPPQLGLC